MHTAVGAKLRQIFVVVVATFSVLVMSGCGVGSIFGSGASPSDSATSQEPTHEEVEAPAEPEPAAESETIVEVDATPVVTDGEGEIEDGDEATSQEIVAGTIELSIESGGSKRVFHYSAGDCFVSPEYILASGTGADVATGEASEVGIGTTPAELLFDNPQTFQADGVISVRFGGQEVVTDGRMITLEGNTIPSTFTYRHDHNSAKYVVAWFSGPSQIGAGYVKVNCDY